MDQHSEQAVLECVRQEQQVHCQPGAGPVQRQRHKQGGGRDGEGKLVGTSTVGTQGTV